MSAAQKSRSRVLPRCFVALRPDAAARDQLDALARELERDCPGSRRMQPGNLHLTLAFIGALDSGLATALCNDLKKIEVPDTAWMIDRVDGFRHARVAWAGGASDPQLSALAEVVRQDLDTRTVPYDRKAFFGHVTLLRHVAQFEPRELAQPIRWRLVRPVLMVSETDVVGQLHYRCWIETPTAQE